MRWETGGKGPRPAPEERLAAKLRRLAHWVVSGEFGAEGEAAEEGSVATGADANDTAGDPGCDRLKPPH